MRMTEKQREKRWEEERPNQQQVKASCTTLAFTAIAASVYALEALGQVSRRGARLSVGSAVVPLPQALSVFAGWIRRLGYR